ncbi:MAG: outer membrane beta-barrel protein [Candidatus Thiodiazotropha sp. (ex Monitilora ramsayi)]|nr:outer membrane beta-barrel protein [Candidatus Thiodiazotropha sp. (ex Monitilora ramsayi)]
MKRYLSLALVGFCFLSTSVNAEEGYFGIGVGTGSYSEADFDESDTGLNIYGGFKAGENLGLEISYTDFGNPEGRFLGFNTSVEVTGLGFSAVGYIPVSDNFNLFGKFGLMAWDADIAVGSISGSEDGTDLLLGFGATYQISNQFALRGAWEFVDVDGGDLDMLSINAQFNF